MDKQQTIRINMKRDIAAEASIAGTTTPEAAAKASIAGINTTPRATHTANPNPCAAEPSV